MQARQRVFDFGTADHYQLLHGGHPFAVAVATKSGDGQFLQRVYPHDDALSVLLNLAGHDDWGTYVSQSGFAAPGGRRTIQQVRALTSLWVDIDNYKLAPVADMDAEQLLDAAIKRFPWMPTPTLLVESGRGCYFVWAFDKPLSKDRLPEWQLVEDALVGLLEPIGADAAARDAARILRVTGSFHVVAGDRVRARRVGDAVTFEAMRQLVVQHGAGVLEKRRAAVLRKPLLTLVDSDIVGVRKRTGKGLSPYRLAFDRMADYRLLAGLRGVPMTDCRHRLLYAYAQAAAWFCGSVHQLRLEVEQFADDHFAGSERYRSGRVQSVVDRFADDGAGKVERLNPERGVGRYRFGNNYIIKLLEITAAEQSQLRTIISSTEKRRRLTDKRRASGMMSRQQYVDRGEQRRLEARRMRSEGMSVPDIAKQLDVSVWTVYKAL
jgi:hypothetical protein